MKFYSNLLTATALLMGTALLSCGSEQPERQPDKGREYGRDIQHTGPGVQC